MSTDVRGVPYDQTSVFHLNIPDPTYHDSRIQSNLAFQPHDFQSSRSSKASERSRSKGTSMQMGSAHETHPHRDTRHNRRGSQASTSHPPGSANVIKPPEEARARDTSTNLEMTRVNGNSLQPASVSGNAPSRNKEHSDNATTYDHGENGSARNKMKVPARNPPTTPILLPENRYCGRCKIVKPCRTHHCRSCGTVRNQVVYPLTFI